MQGYTTQNDGGQGPFQWGAYATDNGGTIITPTGQVAGSWYRIYVGTIFASWFGVVGSGDVTSALQNFATFVTTQGLEGEIPAGTFNISSSILLANHLNGVSGWAIRGSSVGSTILNMTAASGSHLQVTGYNISGWVIEKINFTASSALTSGAAIYFSDSTLAVRMTAYNATIQNCLFSSNCYRAIAQDAPGTSYASNVWGIHIKNCIFYNLAGCVVFAPFPIIGQPNISVEDCYINPGNSNSSGWPFETQLNIQEADNTSIRNVEFNQGEYTDVINAIQTSGGNNFLIENVKMELCNGSINYTKFFNLADGNSTLRNVAFKSIVSAASANVICIEAFSTNLSIDGLHTDVQTLGAGSAIYAVFSQNGLWGYLGNTSIGSNSVLTDILAGYNYPVFYPDVSVPAVTNPSVVSGTVYNNSSYAPINLLVPVTFTPLAGTAATCAIALGSSAAPATISTETVPAGTALDSFIRTITLKVPPYWYYKFTTTNATIGTVTEVTGI